MAVLITLDAGVKGSSTMSDRRRIAKFYAIVNPMGTTFGRLEHLAALSLENVIIFDSSSRGIDKDEKFPSPFTKMDPY